MEIDKIDQRLLQQEVTILECTELVCRLMHEGGMSRQQMASVLDISVDELNNNLDGDLTLRDLSDMLYVMGYSLNAVPVLNPV